MIDTRTRNPVETTSFCLPIIGTGRGAGLVLERDAHTQSYNTPMTSFRDDPEQRLIALLIVPCSRLLLFPVGALLEWHKASRGSEISWDLWRENVATPSDLDELSDVWVSGCRLFATLPGDDDTEPMLQVYDFSVESRERILGSEPDPELGGVRSLRCARKRSYPQHSESVYGSRDTIMFVTRVSATSLLKRTK